jgi:hypothetical protein
LGNRLAPISTVDGKNKKRQKSIILVATGVSQKGSIIAKGRLISRKTHGNVKKLIGKKEGNENRGEDIKDYFRFGKHESAIEILVKQTKDKNLLTILVEL